MWRRAAAVAGVAGRVSRAGAVSRPCGRSLEQHAATMAKRSVCTSALRKGKDGNGDGKEPSIASALDDMIGAGPATHAGVDAFNKAPVSDGAAAWLEKETCVIVSGAPKTATYEDLRELCVSLGADFPAFADIDAETSTSILHFYSEEAAKRASEVLNNATAKFGETPARLTAVTSSDKQLEPLPGEVRKEYQTVSGLMGVLIGKGGTKIKALMEKTNIRTLRLHDEIRQGWMVGTPESIAAAEEALNNEGGLLRSGEVFDTIDLNDFPSETGETLAKQRRWKTTQLMAQLKKKSGARAIQVVDDTAYVVGSPKTVEMVKGLLKDGNKPKRAGNTKPVPRHDEVLFEIDVVPTMLWSLIGKDMANFQTLRQESGVRLLTLSGNREKIWLVGSQPSVDAAITAVRAHKGVVRDGEVVEKLVVPSDKVGVVIGVGGKGIQEVQSSTGVRVFNVSERKNSDATAYVVGAPEAVQNAASWLEDKITESAPVRKRGGWSIPVAGPGEVTKELSLAQSAAGWVIGPKGSRLAQIKTESGASDIVFSNKDNKNDSFQSNCVIIGTEEAVAKAEELILEQVKALRQFTQKGSSDDNRTNSLVGTEPKPRDGEVLRVVTTVPLLTGRLVKSGMSGLRDIRQQSGARLVTLEDGGSKIWVVGSEESVAKAIETLNKSPAVMLEGEKMTEIVVPETAVGLIIGAGGEGIRGIASESGARTLQIAQLTSKHVCLIVGAPEAVEVAAEKVKELITSSAQRGTGRQQGNRRGRFDVQLGVVPPIFNQEPPPFEMSLAPESRQLVLKTGAVPMHRLAEVRAQIFAHSDFSDELRKINRKTDPAEAYFLRLVAAGLAKNPDMSIRDKRDIVRAIRQTITDPSLAESN